MRTAPIADNRMAAMTIARVAMTIVRGIPHTRGRSRTFTFIRESLMRSTSLAALLCLTMTASANAASDADAKPNARPADACAHFVPQGLPHGATVTKNEMRAAQGVFPAACIVRG